MKQLFLLMTVLFFSNSSFGAYLYFNEMMGHVHKSANSSSSSLTTIQCAHAVKLLAYREGTLPPGWRYVQVGDDKGYIHDEYLSDKRPHCFQDSYPKFFQFLELNITELYYWGRLQDRYFKGRSKVK